MISAVCIKNHFLIIFFIIFEQIMQKMKSLYIDATHKTPMVALDAETGELIIRGRSIPNDSANFWQKLIDWFNLYVLSPKPDTLVKLDIEYFNVSSSKYLLNILYTLNDLNNSNHKAKVEWIYQEGDNEMLEVGKDYAFMVNVPFEFKALQPSGK